MFTSVSLWTDNLLIADGGITLRAARICCIAFFSPRLIVNFLGISAGWTWVKSISEVRVHFFHDNSEK